MLSQKCFEFSSFLISLILFSFDDAVKYETKRVFLSMPFATFAQDNSLKCVAPSSSRSNIIM